MLFIPPNLHRFKSTAESEAHKLREGERLVWSEPAGGDRLVAVFHHPRDARGPFLVICSEAGHIFWMKQIRWVRCPPGYEETIPVDDLYSRADAIRLAIDLAEQFVADPWLVGQLCSC